LSEGVESQHGTTVFGDGCLPLDLLAVRGEESERYRFDLPPRRGYDPRWKIRGKGLSLADQFMPVLITLIVAVGFSAVLLGTAALVGQRTRHRTAVKRQSYESGVPLIDRAQKRISVKFYLVALVFVVLDIEVAFLYPWAINYRSFVGDASLAPLWEILAFLTLLILAYLYLWRKGVFDWGRRQVKSTEKGHGE